MEIYQNGVTGSELPDGCVNSLQHLFEALHEMSQQGGIVEITSS